MKRLLPPPLALMGERGTEGFTSEERKVAKSEFSWLCLRNHSTASSGLVRTLLISPATSLLLSGNVDAIWSNLSCDNTLLDMALRFINVNFFDFTF